jgi:stigma-specific protein Stig1
MKTSSLACLLLAGCGTGAPAVDQSQSALLGHDSFGSDCSATDIAMLRTSMKLGRVAALSDAFRQCVDQNIDSYAPWPSDPPQVVNANHATRVSLVVAAARNGNDIFQSCSGAVAGAEAQANIVSFGFVGTESFMWNRNALTSHDQRAALPRCAGWSDGSVCRGADSPYFSVAGVAWHEVMHNQGFDHCNELTDPVGCLGSGLFDRSMPQIVNRCIAGVLSDSGEFCGEMVACGTQGFMTVNAPVAFNAPNPGCSCVADQGPDACAPGQVQCSGVCATLASDGANCGACGNACSAGYACCNGGCFAPASDPSNCGSCGYSCASHFANGAICAGGNCACPSGATRCGSGAAATCASLLSDASNCGQCGHACPSGQVCGNGICTTCPSGQTACAGTCIDTSSDDNNCGQCGHSCYSNQFCRTGRCITRTCNCTRPNLCCPDDGGGYHCARTCY